MNTMREGRGYYAIACTPRGGIFMDVVIFKLDEQRFWYLQADGPFETWLLAHSGGFDVTIKDPRSRVIQIQGPASIDIMHRASDGVIDESMPYFRSGFFNLGGKILYVSSTGFSNELGFEIYSEGDKTNHLALWDHLILTGKAYGMEVSSTRALTIRRIEGGILGNLMDIGITINPYQAGLKPFIQIDKEDFVGRESLLKCDKRKLLFGLTCKTATPSAGSFVFFIGEAVGRITAEVSSPTLVLGIGYIRFFKLGDWIGSTLKIQFSDSSMYFCDIIDVLFFDKEKEIVKGINRTIPNKNLVMSSN
ncbi:MAG: hypothetical protein P8M50_06810 [Paracoccaceae bacterium]|nr:hypothetical protein [Paracoccaceae bacterium]